jgi:hypothetical protein
MFLCVNNLLGKYVEMLANLEGDWPPAVLAPQGFFICKWRSTS